MTASLPDEADSAASRGRMRLEPGYLNSFEVVIRCLKKSGEDAQKQGFIANGACLLHAAEELEHVWKDRLKREPFYVAQVEQDPSCHSEWFNKQTEKAEKEGGVFFRYSVDPENERLALIEVWSTRPDEQRDPRWCLTTP